MTQTIDQTLAERGARYGEFADHAEVTQSIKVSIASGNNWYTLDDDMKEAMEMVAHKFGRILNGDPDYIDSWTDCIGYLRLVEKRLIAEQAEPQGNTVSGIDAFFAHLKAKAEEASAECTDPACRVHNPELAKALKVLLDAGVIKQID